MKPYLLMLVPVIAGCASAPGRLAPRVSHDEEKVRPGWVLADLDKIANDYKANMVSANDRWRGTRVQFDATFETVIEKDGHTSVMASTPELTIALLLFDGDRGEIGKLREGDKFTANCLFSGYTLDRTPNGSYTPVLSLGGCTVARLSL